MNKNKRPFQFLIKKHNMKSFQMSETQIRVNSGIKMDSKHDFP